MELIMELLEAAGVAFIERFFEGEGLVRHYFLPGNQVLEVTVPIKAD